jgi:putative ABC transport system ATP-binding protein
MNTNPLVIVRSVAKTYRRGQSKVDALHNVSLEVQNGEFVVLTGRSGSGKTTLLNLIAALDHPDAGEIIVAGAHIARMRLAAAARYRNERIGIVFQSYSLLPQLTALENVLLPMIPKRRLDRRRAIELLDAVGLGGRSGHRPAEMSGGEQQRVAIARALANDPPLLLADEPTGNLDEENARIIMDLLCSSCRKLGKTLILVSHDRQAVSAADAVFELRAGTLTGRRDGVANSFGLEFPVNRKWTTNERGSSSSL